MNVTGMNKPAGLQPDDMAVRTADFRRPLVLLMLILCLAPVSSFPGGSPGPKPDYLATVTVDPGAPGRAIPTGFLGISHEWDQARVMIGDPDIGTNAIYRQLLTNLISAGAEHLAVRIGGHSADRIGRADPRAARPLAQLFRDLSEPEPQVSFILGLNLARRDPGLAARQAGAYLSVMPPGSVSALEIGHEPDTYADLRTRTGEYRFADYLDEFRTILGDIRKTVPAAPGFIGPSVSASGLKGFGTQADLQKLAALPGVMGLSRHAYPATGTACGGDPQPGMLLQPGSTAAVAEAAGTWLKTVKKPLRITELNAFNCAEPGISNSFESALWIADVLFEYVKTGVSGVNVHLNNRDSTGNWDASGAFQFHIPEAQYQAAAQPAPPAEGPGSAYALKAVLPLYYGMLLFAESAPMRSVLIPAEVSTDANISAWVTRNESTGELKMLLINKEQDLPGRAGLTVPGYRTGKVKRLMAPSLRSQAGITWGGITFDASTDGKPLGKAETETITPEGSVFEVPLGPASAVLITFQK